MNLLKQPIFLIPYWIRLRLLDSLLKHMNGEAANSPFLNRLVPAGMQSASVEQALTEAAKEIGIDGCLATGRWGRFQSSSKDRVMLPIYARTGVWEPEVVRILTDFFDGRRGSYIDIGANIGLILIPVARNASVDCIGFEPEPTNFGNLNENIRRNGTSDNITVHKIALYDKRAELTFGLSEDNMGDHRLGEDRARDSIVVDAMPLDDCNVVTKGPLAIKMDVQGAEMAVLRGGRTTFNKADLVLIEYCPFMIARMGDGPDELLVYLSQFRQIGVRKYDGTEGRLFLDSSEAVDFLRAAFAEQKENEWWYVDITASRDFSIATYY